MKTLPFLPAAVQTAADGELATRLQAVEGHLPAIRIAARRAGIVMRTVRVTSSERPVEFWVFSHRPIPSDASVTIHPPPALASL